MKNSARTILESAIRDNAEYIRDFTDDGNIYKYFAANIQQDDNYANVYFTDDEIEQIENDPDKVEEIYYPFWKLLEEYDYPINEYKFL